MALEHGQEKIEYTLPVEQIIVLPKVKEIVPAMQDAMLSGEYDPLKVVIMFRKMGKLAEEVFKGEKGAEIKEQVFNEIKKHQEGSTSRVYGVEIREQNRSYHDFTECNDPIWEELNSIEKRVKELKKKREAELKLKIPTPGIGMPQLQIAVDYIPELILHENTDLAYINAPVKGSRSTMAYYL